MFNQLSDLPKPDFIDHFPRTAEGHGANARFRQIPGTEQVKRVSLPCNVPRCELNGGRNGEAHEKGRSGNAARWMKEIGYDGPSPGIPPEKERGRKKEAVEAIDADVAVCGPSVRCHDKCQIKGRFLHSHCFVAEPLRVKVLEGMLERISGLPGDTPQAERMLREYLGVERVMQQEVSA